MKTKIIETINGWKAIAGGILNEVETTNEEAVVVALTGDLGSGKTTLVQTIAFKLGVTDTVTSPTFTLLKQYSAKHPNFDFLIHMDAYRIESEKELTPLQFTTLLQQPRTLFCIEWAEKIKSALPANILHYQLEINKENQHTIQRVC